MLYIRLPVSHPPAFDSDFVFAESCLTGEGAAVEKLRELIASHIARFLIKVGAEPAELSEVTTDLLHDLVVGPPKRQPLLRRYTGQCALKTWLIRVATNRWIDRHRYAADSEHPLSSPVSAEWPARLYSDDEPLVITLREAIHAALSACPPQDYVLFELLYREGLHQTELAVMFGCDRRSIARNADRIGAEIRAAVIASVQRRIPAARLDWEDIVELCRAAATDVIPPE